MSRFEIIEEPGQGGGRFEIIEEPQKPRRSTLDQVNAFVRGAADAGSFGFADEFAGYMDTATGLGKGKTVYENTENQRAQDAQDAEDFPWTRFAGQAAGAVATLPLLPLRMLGLGGAGAQTLRATMGQGAKQGAAFGGAYGVGSANPVGIQTESGEMTEPSLTSALTQRAAGGGIGAATGAALGVPLAAGGYGVGRGIDMTRQFFGAHGTGQRSAMTALSGKLAEDGTSPAQIIDDIAPVYKTLTPEQTTGIMETYGRHLGSLGDKRAAVRQTIADVQGTMPGSAASTLERRVREVVKRYDDQTGRGPLMLGEYPSVARGDQMLKGRKAMSDVDLAGFDDSGTRRLFDYLANQSGRGATRIRNAIGERLRQSRERSHKILTDALGTDDFVTAKERIQAKLAKEGNAAYDAAYAAEQPIEADINAVLQKWYKVVGTRKGEVGDAIRSAIQEFQSELVVPGSDRVLATTRTLKEAMDARAVVRGQLERFQAAGTGNSGVAPHLKRFYDDITEAMSRNNPLWRAANDLWGELKPGEKALQLGTEMVTTAGSRMRESLAYFKRLSPGQKEMFRTGFLQRLHDGLSNKVDTHDMSGWIRTEAARAALREVFGDEAAKTIIRRVRDETLATSTARMIENSATHRRGVLAQEMDGATDIGGAIEALNPSRWMDRVTSMASSRIRDRRNNPLAEMISTPMSRPDELYPLLRRLQQHDEALARLRQRTRRPVPRRTTAVSSVLANELMLGERRK